MDAVIAKNNIARYYNTKIIDLEYFWSLSSDSIGELVKLANDKDVAIAAQANAMLNGKKDRLLKKRDWQSFNLADHRARRTLEKGW